MSFKSKIATTQLFTPNTGKFRQYISPVEYEFTKNRIHLPKRSITLLRPENEIFDKSKYELITLEKDDLTYSDNSQFQAKFDNGVIVNLVTTPFNTFLIKWTHKKTLFQKEKRYIITTIIGILTSIGTYFLGQYVGFKSGYQDGLKEANKSSKDTTQIIVPQSAQINQAFVDTSSIHDTFHKTYKIDTAKNKKH